MKNNKNHFLNYFFGLNFVLLFIGELITLHLFSQQEINPNGFNTFYYSNGAISSEGNMRNGKPDGYWKTYFENGTIKSEGNRINYQLDSTWKFFNDEGILVLEYFYKNGKKNGLRKNYDPQEKYLLSDENYINDVKQGLTKFYFKNGFEKKSIPFKDGREEGIGFEYDSTGMIITILEYKAGFVKRQEKINRRDKAGMKYGVWKEFYSTGIVKTECTYSQNKKNGYLKEYNLKGELLNTTKYVDDELIENPPELARLEIFKSYYDDGSVKSEGTYRDGVPEGVFREFAEDGKITGAKIYKDGILTREGLYDERNKEQGPWKEFFPNGQLKGIGEYKDGMRIGEWNFNHPNGKQEQKGRYDKKGKAQGTWKWFYETGKLLREEVYLNDVRDGIMVEYSDSGNVITKGRYIDGLKEDEWIYELGDYKEIGNYKAGRRDGIWKHYYVPSGKLRFEGNYIDDNPDGKHTYYYPNGKVQQTGKYIVGRKEGNWEYYGEDGLKQLTILFKDDVEIKYDGVKLKPTQAEVDKK